MNYKYYSLIKSFEKLTGVPVLLNTSLNVNEPICENPENAFEIFTKTSMDALVMQNWIFTKMFNFVNFRKNLILFSFSISIFFHM